MLRLMVAHPSLESRETLNCKGLQLPLKGPENRNKQTAACLTNVYYIHSHCSPCYGYATFWLCMYPLNKALGQLLGCKV